MFPSLEEDVGGGLQFNLNRETKAKTKDTTLYKLAIFYSNGRLAVIQCDTTIYLWPSRPDAVYRPIAT
jgi:hypothetical protein